MHSINQRRCPHEEYINNGTFPTDLSKAALCQHDEAVVAWKTHPESHREQSLHRGHNERGVSGITIPLPLHPPLLMVELSIEKPLK